MSGQNRRLLFALIAGIGGWNLFGISAFAAASDPDPTTVVSAAIPSLRTDNATINEAFRIAIGDLLGNVQPFQDGLLDRPAPVILAGLHYDTPWTRDAAINAWNGASLIMPDVSRNTLLSVLTRADGKVRIGGQYWDAIVWTTGAWNHYLYTGDRQFVATALEATENSLSYFEQTEFDAATKPRLARPSQNALGKCPPIDNNQLVYKNCQRSKFADARSVLGAPAPHSHRSIPHTGQTFALQHRRNRIHGSKRKILHISQQ